MDWMNASQEVLRLWSKCGIREKGESMEHLVFFDLWGRWMSSYTVGDPKDYPPLQAADIWAYSLGHVHEHHPPKKEEATVAFDFFLGFN